MKKYVFFLSLFLAAPSIFAQYEIDPQVITLDDIIFVVETTDLYIPNERENVRTIGMGKTQVSNGRKFDAMISTEGN